MIYLDNAATTPMLPEVVEAYEKATANFFNPSSLYQPALFLRERCENVKAKICKKLGVNFDGNFIFTGSATEANNLALFGLARKNFEKILVTEGEHPSVYNSALALQQQGYVVEFVPLAPNGEIDYVKLDEMMTPSTGLVSVIHVSNETGAVNDLARISRIIRRKNKSCIFHSDGVQAFGKLSFILGNFGVDAYTISAHKMHGPKGIGGLWVRDRKLLKPIMHGGEQEYNLRPGTENTANIFAFEAAVNALSVMDYDKLEKVCSAFKNNLSPNIKCNLQQHSPYILSITCPGVKGETLVNMLSDKEVYIGTGSSCSSKKVGNKSLASMGLKKKDIEGSLRISFSKLTSPDLAARAAQILSEAYETLKAKMK